MVSGLPRLLLLGRLTAGRGLASASTGLSVVIVGGDADMVEFSRNVVEALRLLSGGVQGGFGEEIKGQQTEQAADGHGCRADPAGKPESEGGSDQNRGDEARHDSRAGGGFFEAGFDGVVQVQTHDKAADGAVHPGGEMTAQLQVVVFWGRVEEGGAGRK
jgi:hypothetical protein